MAYLGYTGGNKDYSSSRKSRLKALSSYYAAKEEEDARILDEKKRQTIIEEQKKSNLKAGKNEDGSSKDGWSKFVDVAQGVGKGLWKSGADVVDAGAGLVSSAITGDRDNAVSEETKKWKQSADKWGDSVGANGVGEFVGNLPGGIVKGITDEASYLTRGVHNTPEMIAAGIAAGSDDKNVRKIGIEEQKKLQAKLFGDDVSKNGDGAMLAEGLAKAGGAIVDVATAGTGSTILKGGKATAEQVAKQFTKGAIAKGATRDAFINAATGVPVSTAEQYARGEEITPGSVANDVLIQGLTGGLMSGASRGMAASKQTKTAIRDTSSRVFNDTKTNGGATVTTDGKPVSEGFSYSPFKDAETIIDEKSFSQKDVEKFMKQHKKELSDPNNNVGTLVNDGKVYLDISRVLPDREAAIKEAAGNKQLAIYDLGKGEEIGVGVIGDNGKYTAFADVPQKDTPLALPAGFKDNAYYDGELERFQRGEFTPEDDVWADRTVTMDDGTTVDLNKVDGELKKNQAAIRDLEQQASGKDLAGNTAMDINEGIDPSAPTPDIEGRLKAIEKIDELNARNKELMDIRSKAATISDAGEMKLDPKKAGERFKALKAEQEAAREYNYNMNGRTPDEIKSDIDAIDSGHVPDDLRDGVKRHKNSEDISADDTLPHEIRSVANEVASDKAYAQWQLDNLETPLSASEKKDALSAQYKEQKAALTDLDEVQQKYELDKLTQEYQDELMAIDDKLDGDAEKVNQLMDVMDNIKAREGDVVKAANWYMTSNADNYMHADPKLIAQRRAELQSELDEAVKYSSPRAAVERAVEAGEDLTVKAKEDGQVRQAIATDVEDALAGAKVADPIIGMGLRSPSHIFEKMGLGKMFNNITRAYQSTVEHTMDDMKTIAAIGRALDAEDIDGADIIKYIRGETDSIPARQDKLAKMVQEFFDEKRAGMESIGYKGIDNYFPEYVNKDDPNFKRLFGDKESGNISFASFKHREGNLGDFNKDIVDVMRIYSQGYNKKMYLEPSLKDIESVKNIKGVNEAVANWTNDYLKQLKGTTKPSEIERIYNMAVDRALGTNKFTKGMVGGSHYRSNLADARMYVAISTMGLNPATAIRNMTQAVNTTAEFGTKNSLVGMAQGTKALLSGMKDKSSPMWKELKDAGVIDGGVARNYADELDKLILGQGKWAGRKVKAVDGMMAMIRWTDISLRAQAYYAAKAAGRAKGLKGQDLLDFAQSGAIKTQFNTSRLDMPTNLNGPGVRSLTQLATFSIKQTEFLAELGIKTFKDPKTGQFKPVPNAGNVGRLVQATALGAGFTATLGPLVGFQAEEFNPWNQQFGEDSADKALYRSPLVKLAIGDGKGKSGLFDIFNMNDDKTAGEAAQEFWNDNWNMLIPAGSQMKKSSEGYNLVTTGESQNAKGNTRFLRDSSDGGFDSVKALLFGQYATKSGQEWLDSGMKTLSEKQTGQIQGLPQDKKQQYYDYYMQSKEDIKTTFSNGRDEAVQKIKETAKTNEALARQMAEEYNSKVDANMGKYWAKHKEMPSRLKDEMFGELRIDATKQIESAKKRPSLKSLQRDNAYDTEDMGL